MLPGSFLSYSVSHSVRSFQCHSKSHVTIECRKVGEYWIEDWEEQCLSIWASTDLTLNLNLTSIWIMSAERAGEPHSKALTIICKRLWQSGAWGLEENKYHPGLQKRTRGKNQWATDQSASLQSLGRWWNTSFWRPSLSTWMTRRRSEVVSRDLLKVNQAWLAWLPSAKKQLPGWMKGHSGYCLPWL